MRMEVGYNMIYPQENYQYPEFPMFWWKLVFQPPPARVYVNYWRVTTVILGGTAIHRNIIYKWSIFHCHI